MAGIQSVLARNAKRLRILQGKTQREMSELAGVSQKTISNLEVANSPISPKLSTVEAIAAYFRLHPAVLLLDGVTDEALTDRQIGAMIEQFARLPDSRKRQIMSLVDDFHKIGEKQD